MAKPSDLEDRSALEQRLTTVEVGYQSLDHRLEDIQESFIKRFEEIKSQLSQVSRDFSHAQKFPITTVISACTLILGIIIALGSGYIGKPLTEVKNKQDWVLDRLWTMKYEAGRSEQIIKRNKEDIIKLDTNLQREMRDRDEVIRHDLETNIEKSAASIRHMEEIIHGLQESEKDNFSMSDFQWAFENYLKKEE